MLIKNQRRYWLKHIIYQIVEKIWQVRHLDAGWSNSETYNKLKPYQKLWLDRARKEQRNEVDFELIKKDLSSWIVKTYNKNIDKNTTRLGDDHKPDIGKIIDEVQEALL
jgi:CRISPR-associated protein Csy1